MCRYILGCAIFFMALSFAMGYAQDAEYGTIIDTIQRNVGCDREAAEALLAVINYFAEGIQTEFSYLASSKDDIYIKEIRIKKTIQKYFESERSIVQVSNVHRKPIYDYEIRTYLDRLARLALYKYTRVELLFDPDYLGIGQFLQTGPNSYELSVSMWQIFRAWMGNELAYADATKKKFRLNFVIEGDRVQVKISEILVSETTSLEKYKGKFKVDN